MKARQVGVNFEKRTSTTSVYKNDRGKLEAAGCSASHQHHSGAPVPSHQHKHLWPHASGSWGSWVTPQKVGAVTPHHFELGGPMPEAAGCSASHQHHSGAPVPSHQHGHLWPHASGSWGSWVTPHAIWRWVAPWPTQGMAGLTLGTQGAAQGIATRQGQCWVPHEQRKAWLGSRWVLMAWGLTQGKVGCPRSSARHCQGKAECPRCSARGDYLFPPTVAH